MKKFIGENWFKILILLLVSIILLYIINIEKQRQLDDLNTTCQRLASQKKDEISKNNPNLYIGEGDYEYKYNLVYKGCILAYFGIEYPGRNLFKIDNLSTGESIMNSWAGGDLTDSDMYSRVYNQFYNLKKQYLGHY